MTCWWRFRGQKETHAAHASIMTWAPFSQLKFGGKASRMLGGNNKWAIVYAWVHDCVRVSVVMMVGLKRSGTTLMNRPWPGVMWWVKANTMDTWRRGVNNFNPCLCVSSLYPACCSHHSHTAQSDNLTGGFKSRAKYRRSIGSVVMLCFNPNSPYKTLSMMAVKGKESPTCVFSHYCL